MNCDNGAEGQKFAYLFLTELQKSDYRIVFCEGNPWAKKAFEVMKSQIEGIRVLSKLLHSIIKDLDKTIIVSGEIKIEEYLLERVPEDDRYLVSMGIEAKASYIVTTDVHLRECIEQLAGEGRLTMKAIGKEEFYQLLHSRDYKLRYSEGHC